MMSASKEPVEHADSSVLTRRSYFALIPVFRKRKSSRVENNIVSIIHEYDICKSNPILRTILIQNVRICCVVVETTGQHSVRFLCASAPHILSLFCKVNPKLESLVKSEKVSSCFKILQESDFEFLLSNVYHTTVTLHQGVKKYYPTICFSMIKDSAYFSEKSISYLLHITLKALQAVFAYIYENLVPAFQYLYEQNYKFARILFDNFPQLVATSMKTSVIMTIYLQNAILAGFKLLKKLILCVNLFLNNMYAGSPLCDILKQVYLYLNSLSVYFHSSSVYSSIKQYLQKFLDNSKPYLWENFQKLFDVIKNYVKQLIPFFRNCFRYFYDEIIPSTRTFIRNNQDRILIFVKTVTSFIYKNMDNIKLIFSQVCQLLYLCVSRLYKIFQVVLPYIIECSSSAIIHIISCLTVLLENCIRTVKVLCAFLSSKYFERRLRSLFRLFTNMLKGVYQTILNARPYMVLIIYNICSGLSEMIHNISPILKAILFEINSSIFNASNEVLVKSYLATRRITPSLWCSIKTIAPPTIMAVNEVVNSSKSSVIIVSPALLKALLTIRPELKACIIVLFSDGSKACLEVATASYSVSYQMRVTAKNVSSNLPVVYKAAQEVLITTTKAVVEVTTTSFKAKSRISNDLARVRQVVGTSVILAEQELIAAYTAANSEINYLLCSSHEYLGYDSDSVMGNLACKMFSTLCTIYCNFLHKLNNLFKIAIYALHGMTENVIMCLEDIFEVLIHISCHIISFALKFCNKYQYLGAPETSVLTTYLFNLLNDIYGIVNSVSVAGIKRIAHATYNYIVHITPIVLQRTCLTLSSLWKTLKSCVKISWEEMCQQAPEFWIMIEHLSSKLWNFAVDHTPEAWQFWKYLCTVIWELICSFMPYAWKYSSTAVPALWRSGREFVKNVWNLSMTSSSFMWENTTTLTSEYWLLSSSYLPQMWVMHCEETRKSWKLACCVTEACWSFSVEACLLSWNILHNSVARSWRKGLVLTKTAYTICSTAGSVMKKGVCVCYRTKNYIHVILPARRQHDSFDSSGIKLQTIAKDGDNSLELSDIRSKSDIFHSEKSSFGEYAKNYIFNCVNSFSRVDLSKIVKYKVLITSIVCNKYSDFKKSKLV